MARPEGFGVLLDVASGADGERAFVPLGAVGEDGFEDAVDEQIGIAADGRGEVGVAGGGEGEVAVVDFGVARLLEGAQHEIAENALLGFTGDFGGELLVHGWGDGDLLRDFDLLRLGAVGGGAGVGRRGDRA